jgi:hypothetical protein
MWWNDFPRPAAERKFSTDVIRWDEFYMAPSATTINENEGKGCDSVKSMGTRLPRCSSPSCAEKVLLADHHSQPLVIPLDALIHRLYLEKRMATKRRSTYFWKRSK